MRKDQLRERRLALLARLPEKSAKAKILRRKLGVKASAPAPAPVVEEPVVEEPVVEEPVVEAVEEVVEEAPKPKRKRAPRKKKSEQ